MKFIFLLTGITLLSVTLPPELLLFGAMFKEKDSSLGKKGSPEHEPAPSVLDQWVNSSAGEGGVQFPWRPTAALPRLPARVPGSAHCSVGIVHYTLTQNCHCLLQGRHWITVPGPCFVSFGLSLVWIRNTVSAGHRPPQSGRFLKDSSYNRLRFYWKQNIS